MLVTLRQFESLSAELARIEQTLAALALRHPSVRRLMTVPGIDAVTALAVVAAIGDIHRFRSPAKLVGYFGLDPRVWQSGSRVMKYGAITKRGRAHARATLVEAAWAAVKTSRSLAGVLPAPQDASWAANRRRWDSPQARSVGLASAHTERGVCLRPPVSSGAEVARARAPGRALSKGRPARHGPRVQLEDGTPSGVGGLSAG